MNQENIFNHSRSEAGYAEQQVLDIYGDMHVPGGHGKELAWEKLEMAIASRPERNQLERRRVYVVALAASLAILLMGSATGYFFLAKTTLHAGRGETFAYRLPDETEVVLNADSRISFRKFGWKNNRRLTLKGEAFFHVMIGGDFRVETSEAAVQVVGTSFNVYSREGNFRVTCEKGVLLVSARHFEVPDTLTGERAIEIKRHNGLYDVRRFETGKRPAASWITGEFYFDNAPLHEVFSEIGRQFDVEVLLPDHVKDRRYSGYFRNDNLVEALNLVCIPMNVSFSVDKDRQVRIE